MAFLRLSNSLGQIRKVNVMGRVSLIYHRLNELMIKSNAEECESNLRLIYAK